VDALNENNETPLFLAVKVRALSVVEVLVEFKASKNLGKDPLLVVKDDVHIKNVLEN